jgi:hypothetical protein
MSPVLNASLRRMRSAKMAKKNHPAVPTTTADTRSGRRSNRTGTPRSARAISTVTAACALAIRTLNSTFPIRYSDRLSG